MKLFGFLTLLIFSSNAFAFMNLTKEAKDNLYRIGFGHTHNSQCDHSSNLGDIADALDSAWYPVQEVDFSKYNAEETASLMAIGKVQIDGEHSGEGVILAETDCKIIVRGSLHEISLPFGKGKYSAQHQFSDDKVDFVASNGDKGFKLIDKNLYSGKYKYTNSVNDWVLLTYRKPRCGVSYGKMPLFDFKKMDMSEGIVKLFCYHNSDVLKEQICTSFSYDVLPFKIGDYETYQSSAVVSCNGVPGSSGCSLVYHKLTDPRQILQLGNLKSVQVGTTSAGSSLPNMPTLSAVLDAPSLGSTVILNDGLVGGSIESVISSFK